MQTKEIQFLPVLSSRRKVRKSSYQCYGYHGSNDRERESKQSFQIQQVYLVRETKISEFDLSDTRWNRESSPSDTNSESTFLPIPSSVVRQIPLRKLTLKHSTIKLLSALPQLESSLARAPHTWVLHYLMSMTMLLCSVIVRVFVRRRRVIMRVGRSRGSWGEWWSGNELSGGHYTI